MEAVLQTLIGGFLALGGALIGPFLQRRHDRWVAKRQDDQLLRDKAQELFDEIDAMVSASQASMLSALARMRDKAASETIPVPDLGRIRAISTVYFPVLFERISKFEADTGAFYKKVVEMAEGSLKTGEEGLETLKSMPFVMTGQYQTLTAELATDLRAQLRGVVPKL